MNRNFHGLFSLMLMGLAIMTGLTAVFRASPDIAIIYVFLIIISSVIIIYSYCAKCSCGAKSCSHVYPGKLVKFLPERKQENYKTPDYLGLIVGIGIIYGFPQYWLRQNKAWFFVFLGLSIISVLEILLHVCKTCDNRKCLMCRKG